MPRTKKPTPLKPEKPKTESRRGKNLPKPPKRPSLKEMAAVQPDVGYFKAVSATAINLISAETWAAFLHELANSGHVSNSCKKVGLNRITAYARRAQDAEFRDAWEQAHQIGMSVLEDEAKRRAYEGIEKGVYYKGDRVDTEIVYSDALLMFLMQGRDARYKRKQEITGADGGPLGIIAKLDDDGLDELIAQRQRELKETPDA